MNRYDAHNTWGCPLLKQNVIGHVGGKQETMLTGSFNRNNLNRLYRLYRLGNRYGSRHNGLIKRLTNQVEKAPSKG